MDYSDLDSANLHFDEAFDVTNMSSNSQDSPEPDVMYYNL